MWDERYASKEYAYGTEPNDFLVDMVEQIPQGKVLCLADGEGRNGVWLAQQGHDVTSVDASQVGLDKAQKLATEKQVSITTQHADLADYDLGIEKWDAIVSIFCHLPPPLRRVVHQRCVEALRPGGVIVLEAYTPQQLEYKTGGPPVAEMMMSSESIKQEFEGLEFITLQETVRDIHEGEFHHGKGAVVQLLAKKL